MTKPQTRSQKEAAGVAALQRARNPVLWVTSKEESRVERYLIEACASAGYTPRTWDCGQGVCDITGKVMRLVNPNTGDYLNAQDPGELLNYILASSARKDGGERITWILRDFHAWLNGPIGIGTLRQLCNIARARPTMTKQAAQAVIVLSPSSEIPQELMGHVTVIDWPLPDREEIASTLKQAIQALPENEREAAASNGNFDAAVDAAIGLSESEAASCYGRSLVQTRKIDPAIIANEKKRVIAREKVLEWFDPLPGGLDAIGGLGAIKKWIALRVCAYTKKARDYGLPAPKGIFLLGVQGCGKSMIAKAIATFLGCPLLRLDLGALKGKFVGESEARMRRMMQVVESIGKCVLWIDEIEKALQGATSGSADGGTSADQLGVLLNWLQERQGECFVIATSNDADVLPPELLRKGRFDEIFFVDLPNQSESAAILQVTLKKHGRGQTVDVAAVIEHCKGFSGAELASLVPDAMFQAFNDNERDITTADLISVAKDVVPLSKAAAKKIEALRNWKKEGRARDASLPELVTQAPQATPKATLDL